MTELDRAVPDLVSCLVVAAGSVLSVALMAHHPTTGAADVASALLEIAREARQTRLVHGGLIALMLLVFHGLVTFARALGWHLARVRAGTLAYGLGVVLHTLAALTNGFVVPALAERNSGRTETELEALRPLLAQAHVANQALAMTAVVAMSAAIFVWSCALLGRGRFALVLGLFGLLMGGAHALWIPTGHVHLGRGAKVGAKSAVTKNVAPGEHVAGIPAGDVAEWREAVVLIRRLPDMKDALARLEARLATLEARLK